MTAEAHTLHCKGNSGPAGSSIRQFAAACLSLVLLFLALAAYPQDKIPEALTEDQWAFLEQIRELQWARLYWIELINSLNAAKPRYVWFTRLALENGSSLPGGPPGPTRPEKTLELTGYIKIRRVRTDAKHELARQIEELRLEMQGVRQRDLLEIACREFEALPFPDKPRNESLQLIHTLLRRRTDKFKKQVKTYLKSGTPARDLIPIKALGPLLEQAGEEITEDSDKEEYQQISEYNNEFERVLDRFNGIAKGDFFGRIEVKEVKQLKSNPEVARFIFKVHLKRTLEF